MKKIFYNEQTKEYTFSEKTEGALNKNVIPPKFSTNDKFGEYRRTAKKDLKKRELSGEEKE